MACDESDPERIHEAFQTRYEEVRRYHLGSQAAIASRVLGELSTAFNCLSDDGRRADYWRQQAAAAVDRWLAAPNPPEDIEQLLGCRPSVPDRAYLTTAIAGARQRLAGLDATGPQPARRRQLESILAAAERALAAARLSAEAPMAELAADEPRSQWPPMSRVLQAAVPPPLPARAARPARAAEIELPPEDDESAEAFRLSTATRPKSLAIVLPALAAVVLLSLFVYFLRRGPTEKLSDDPWERLQTMAAAETPDNEAILLALDDFTAFDHDAPKWTPRQAEACAMRAAVLARLGAYDSVALWFERGCVGLRRMGDDAAGGTPSLRGSMRRSLPCAAATIRSGLCSPSNSSKRRAMRSINASLQITPPLIAESGCAVRASQTSRPNLPSARR